MLTLDELKQLVDSEYPTANANRETNNIYAGGHGGGMDITPAAQQSTDMRWLLARRLVREDRYQAARPYFPAKIQPILDQYTTLLGKVEKAGSKPEKADALWKTAQLTRDSGMELMGLEMEPDAFIWEGNFEELPVAQGRERGRAITITYEYKRDAQGNDEEVEVPQESSLTVPATTDERKRLGKTHIVPEKRFHYRYLAAGLAWKAALLMPDNDEQTATVLNTAGCWLKDHDDKAADRFYEALATRCAETPTGREAIKRHWFVPLPDPPQ
ncbi:MAG: hypothetical protein QM796_12785 [Chthoniobacteraceae bacterium]